eukprot:2121171-Lingulodinium_polyedra.AAC.1
MARPAEEPKENVPTHQNPHLAPAKTTTSLPPKLPAPINANKCGTQPPALRETSTDRINWLCLALF